MYIAKTRRTLMYINWRKSSQARLEGGGIVDDREYLASLRRDLKTMGTVRLRATLRALLDWIEKLLTELGR